MALKVKICGITNIEDALLACKFGADALGFVFYKKSPRYVTIAQAKKIIETLPPFVITVGVFVDEGLETIISTCKETGLDTVQLHGDESPHMCSDLKHRVRRIVKAFRVRDFTDLNTLKAYSAADAFLLDTYTEEVYGGSGTVFNWDIAQEAGEFGNVILAGGLTPENIEEAVRRVNPYAVDVSSGVEEKKGKKDLEKLRLFIERAKSVLF
ncbi:MAG: phosphoribosylanthranilate isomerase [Nitrospirae bacterium]|nr:phosphoribosylanthranilate isomerase [Nitrospirota bacterium]MBF0536336.1 phosphoribosylanthranilate isomerase [Nitrospirota bacterium]MBF0618277.1 phosphoribosylanthranilate isomerase [Nitrospirota bacterium]